jgi:hypothetical protein
MEREQIIELAAGGNEDAQRLLTVFVGFAHTLDDVVDGDRAVPDDELLQGVLNWTCEAASNPFFQQHRAALLPVILLAVNSWLDANRWARAEDPRQRLAADVLKGQYHEVVYLVAFLTGGWRALRALTAAAREYDFETVAPAPPAQS